MIQFISHHNDKYSYIDGIRLALEGGCRWIQLRMKEASDEEARDTALEAQALCKSSNATFIIDDRVGLAKDIKADGVHLGKNDMPVGEARQALGSQAIIGGTANTIDDIKRLCQAGADYIGCGPFRFTTTKKKLAPQLGIEGYRDIVEKVRAAGVALPIVAIGGIVLDDIDALMATGINGIAMSSAIINAPDPVAYTSEVLEKLAKQQS